MHGLAWLATRLLIAVARGQVHEWLGRMADAYDKARYLKAGTTGAWGFQALVERYRSRRRAFASKQKARAKRALGAT